MPVLSPFLLLVLQITAYSDLKPFCHQAARCGSMQIQTCHPPVRSSSQMPEGSWVRQCKYCLPHAVLPAGPHSCTVVHLAHPDTLVMTTLYLVI